MVRGNSITEAGTAGYEPYSEVMASLIAQVLGLPDYNAWEIVKRTNACLMEGVQLEEFFHILQLTLRVLDLLVYALQSLGEFRGITADFNGNALNSTSHAQSPP